MLSLLVELNDAKEYGDRGVGRQLDTAISLEKRNQEMFVRG